MSFALVRLLCWALALCAGIAGAAEPAASAAAFDSSSPTARVAVPTAPVVVLTIDGAIHPATADHFRRALSKAVAQHAQLVVLQLDTPGGLDTSMRAMIKDILGSPIPVATYVWPNGARAASAGTYLLYASQIAAMAPATNLGAATPVSIGVPGLPSGEPPKPAGSAASSAESGEKGGGDPMSAKRLADASAYIRSLAQLRGRNAEWAEKAVRESVSLSASEALGLHVVDLVASDLKDLLRQVDGRSYDVSVGRVTLATATAPVVTIDAGWRSELLSVIANPSFALILMMIGVYGLIFEFMNPGFVLPGVVGAISLLLGLYALQTLPINYAGLALIVLGIAFLVAEAFIPSFGALGLGGIVAFVLGAVMLVDSDVPGVRIPYPLIGLLALLSAGFVLAVVGMAVKARQRPVVSGAPALVGQLAELVEFDGREGWALLAGVHWKVDAAAAADARELLSGMRVVVRGVRGSTLSVARAPPASSSSSLPDAAQP